MYQQLITIVRTILLTSGDCLYVTITLHGVRS